jgi:hypothetical protein
MAIVWRSHTGDAEFPQPTWGPGVELIVALRNHTISAQRDHDLDIEVGSVRVMTLSARLAVHVGVNGAVAVIKDGRLLAIRSGQAEADGKVTLEGVQVAHKGGTFPLAAHLGLRSPRLGDGQPKTPR